jgi:hypothetical protein
MAYDFTQYFGHDYVPSYMSAVRPDQLAQALQYLTAGGPRGHGGNLATHIGDIYGSFQKNTGLHAPVKVWAQQYWDWLSKGAQTKHNYASTLQNVDTGNVSANVLHYVPGQGYVTEADLQSVDPAQYQAIQDERAAAVKDTGAANAYYESNPGTTGQGAYSKNLTNLGWARNMQGAGAMKSYLPKTPPPNLNPPPAGAGAPAGTGNPVNNGVGGNRNSNYATTAVPGATAVTPKWLSGSGASRQATERAAKRVGRDISQSGVTKVPNMRQAYSRLISGGQRKY